jgi:predicted aminopeptidase
MAADAAPRMIRSFVIPLCAVLLGSCSSAEFYFQGISGQIDLLRRAQPIPDVLDSAQDPIVKHKLERVLAIREYASRELAEPDNDSYRRYSDPGAVAHPAPVVLSDRRLRQLPRLFCRGRRARGSVPAVGHRR